jgi:hypothetical protein
MQTIAAAVLDHPEPQCRDIWGIFGQSSSRPSRRLAAVAQGQCSASKGTDPAVGSELVAQVLEREDRFPATDLSESQNERRSIVPVWIQMIQDLSDSRRTVACQTQGQLALGIRKTVC